MTGDHGVRRVALAIVLSFNVGAAAQTIVPASPADRPSPDFPAGAGTTEGEVKIRFDIGPDGHVTNRVILSSHPTAVFDQAALDGVSRWLYHPRTVGGRPVMQAGMVVNLQFKPDLSTEPVLRFSPPVYYPRPAYEGRIEGKVKIAFDVTNLGSTEKLRVVDSTPPGIFDRAALENVSSFMYDPDASALPAKDMTTTVSFKLTDARLKAVREHLVRPTYPRAAEQSGIMGNCSIEYWIEPNGTVSDVHVLLCFPSGFFEQSSMDAMRASTFKPEADPMLNRRRRETTSISYRIQGVPEGYIHYLKHGEWVRLRYTLTPTGRATHVEVVAKSSPGLYAGQAVEQLKDTTMTPILQNGVPIEQPNRYLTITGR